MLSTRKRKVSSDQIPENSAIKKLKVGSSIICPSTSTEEPNSVAKTKLNQLLPDGYESIILTANTKPKENVEGFEAIYGCIRLPIVTQEDALVWVKKFERKTFTLYRSQKCWKNDPKIGLSKRKFLCAYHNPDKEYSCKACIIFTIKDAKEVESNPEYYLRDYPSQVIIQFCHNHKTDPDIYLKNLHPTTKLRVIFSTYFANGHSPFSALICHKCDLHSSYGSEFYNIISNGSICPSYNWCFWEFQKLFNRKFLEPSQEELLSRLNDAITLYNTKCQTDSALLIDDPGLVLSFCAPLMKSVFRSGFAEDLITVRTFCTPKTISKRQKLILFLCHTPIGSLPFGVVVTLTDDANAICKGIKNLLKMLEASSYCPNTIITDENALISKTLNNVFPKSQVLFNEFQMLQSIWRISRLVCMEDNIEFQVIYDLFLVTLNSDCEADFNRNFDNLQIYAEKYPKLSGFLKYFKSRSHSYVLYARPQVEFNTDVLNYTDSGTIILQDVSIKYGDFLNILQLFDFLTNSYVNHYERKLVKIVEGDLKGFFKTNFFVPISNLDHFTCEKISDTEFSISVNNITFFVNAELDTCTCQVGVHGGSCVHQYIVERNIGLVPECYTPLGEDMLGIFKLILPYKDPCTENLNDVSDSIKTGSDPLTEGEFNDFIPSLGSISDAGIEKAITQGENWGPVDEIYLVPSEVADSFKDEDTSILELSEYEDLCEDNYELLNDTGQYNKESGELEPIELAEPTTTQQKVVSAGLHYNSKDSASNINTDTKGITVCDCGDDEAKSEHEMKQSMVLPADLEEYNVADNTIGTDLGSPLVYTYATENEDQMDIYGAVMTESDKKTAEIAEFLTNLPDTNNSNYGALNTTDPVVSSTDSQFCGLQDVAVANVSLEPEKACDVIKQEITPARGSEKVSSVETVIKPDGFFGQYRVMENGVLSIVTDTDDEYAKQISTFQQAASAQNFMEDSYEETNLAMMSPTDLFDNDEDMDNLNLTAHKTDERVNVLSSVVIKAPMSSHIPLNLNAIKSKTVRTVKEVNRNRIKEPLGTQTDNIIFLHNMLKSEPKKIILPAIELQPKVPEGLTLNVLSKSDNEKSVKSNTRQVEYVKDGDQSLFKLSQLKNKVSMSEVETALEAKAVLNVEDTHSNVDTRNSNITQKECEVLNLLDCDSEILDEEHFEDVIEIDSDELEELASQDYNQSLNPSYTKRISKSIQKPPLKVAPLNQIPCKLTPIDSTNFPIKAIPLKDFISKKREEKKAKPLTASAGKGDDEEYDKSLNKKTANKNEVLVLKGQLTTAFSHLTDLANKDDFKDSVEKFLGKFKELGTGDKLISALESFGSDSRSVKTNQQVENYVLTGNIKEPGGIVNSDLNEQINEGPINSGKIYTTSKDTDEDQDTKNRNSLDMKKWEDADDFIGGDSCSSGDDSSDSDDFHSEDFAHYSNCRSSCSDFHSELEGIDDLSNEEQYDFELSSNESSGEYATLEKSSAKGDPEKSEGILNSKNPTGIISKEAEIRKDANKCIKSSAKVVHTPSQPMDNINITEMLLLSRTASCPKESTTRKHVHKVSEHTKKYSILPDKTVAGVQIRGLSSRTPLLKAEQKLKTSTEMKRKTNENRLWYIVEDLVMSDEADTDTSKNIKEESSRETKKRNVKNKQPKNLSPAKDIKNVVDNIKMISDIDITKKTKMRSASVSNIGDLLNKREERKYNNVSVSRIKLDEGIPMPYYKTSVIENTCKKTKPSSSTITPITKSLCNASDETLKQVRKVSPLQVPKKNIMSKDARDLESILTDEADVDSSINNANYESKLVTKITSISESEELSFLFKDPRFEMIVENAEDTSNEANPTNMFPSNQADATQQLIYVLCPPMRPEKFDAFGQNNNFIPMTTCPTASETKLVPSVVKSANREKTDIGVLEKRNKAKLMTNQTENAKSKKEKTLTTISKDKNQETLNSKRDFKTKKVKRANYLENVDASKCQNISTDLETKVTANKSSTKERFGGKNHIRKLSNSAPNRPSTNESETDSDDTIVPAGSPSEKYVDKLRTSHDTEPKNANVSRFYKTKEQSSPVQNRKLLSKFSQSRSEKESPNSVKTPLEKVARRRGRPPLKRNVLPYISPHISSCLKEGNNSVDFESSRAASVSVKTPPEKVARRRGRPPLKRNVLPSVSPHTSISLLSTTSTPTNPVRYEDAFRRFLETSDNYRGKTESQSFSDFECKKDETKTDSKTVFRRKTKSLYGWAQGIQGSGSSSDDSEVCTPSKSNAKNNEKPKKSLREFKSSAQNIYKKNSHLDMQKHQLWYTFRNGESFKKSLKSPFNITRSSITSKLQLIVLLERNLEIEAMCKALKKYSSICSRSSRGVRRGYKELLENAKRLKGLG